MEKIKSIFTNRIFLLCTSLVLFIIIFAGFTSWYLIAQADLKPETNLVPKTSTTQETSTDSVDEDVSDIDREVNSTTDEDFSDSQLNDSQVGL